MFTRTWKPLAPYLSTRGDALPDDWSEPSSPFAISGVFCLSLSPLPLPRRPPAPINEPNEVWGADALVVFLVLTIGSSLTAKKSRPQRLMRLRVASQGSLTSGGEEAFIRGWGKNLIHSNISTCS